MFSCAASGENQPGWFPFMSIARSSTASRATLCLDDPGPHGIEGNIMADRSGRARLHRQGLVAPLKHMPALLPKPVKPQRKRRLQPAHSVHQVRLWHPNTQMVVVGHHSPGVDPPTGLRARLSEAFQKNRLRPFLPKHVPSVVAAADDVVDRARVFQSQFPRDASIPLPAARPSPGQNAKFDPFRLASTAESRFIRTRPQPSRNAPGALRDVSRGPSCRR
jgi:hypothetical protein